MDGLIIKEPFASMIIDGGKIWELRSREPPKNKIKSKIALLSHGKVLGTIEITGSRGPLTLSHTWKIMTGKR